MLLNAFYFLAGSVLIYFGAEFFVRSASNIARALRISPFIIGVTIVAFGTSLPEFVVSLSAYVDEATDIAVGNIVGSNISNIGLILGIAGIITPLAVRRHIFKFDLPFNLGVALALFFLVMDGVVTTTESILLLAGFCFFVVHYVLKARSEQKLQPRESDEDLPRVWPNLLMAAVGAAALWGGGDLFIDAAVFFAEYFGVPEFIVGVSVVAIGTSLPELMTSLVAVARKQDDIGVGNILGSNVFNVLFVLGILGVIRPITIQAPNELLISAGIMIGFIVILFPLLRLKFMLQRIEAALLLAAYLAYLVYLFLTSAAS